MAFVLVASALASVGASALYLKRKRDQFKQLIAHHLEQLDKESTEALNSLLEPTKTTPLLNAITEDEETDESDSIQTIDELPECVRRFLDHCVRDSRTFRLFKLTQDLKLRFKQPDGPWISTPGTNTVCPLKPAMLFHGVAAMNPVTWVDGFEKITNGEGAMQWRMWGAVTVADHTGPVMQKACIARWLSEAMAFPQALKPSKYLRWEPIEPYKARAIVTYAGITVSGIFTFDSRYNIIGFYSSDYSKIDKNGNPKPCGLKGRCWGHMLVGLSEHTARASQRDRHATVGGIMVPMEAEASFVDEDGNEETYVKVLLRHIDATE